MSGRTSGGNDDIEETSGKGQAEVDEQLSSLDMIKEKFKPGGEMKYAEYPTRPKVWEELPIRGVDKEILLGNTAKTVIPTIIIQEPEVYDGANRVQPTKRMPKFTWNKAVSRPRSTGNMVAGGREPRRFSRLPDSEVVGILNDSITIDTEFVRGMANSSFYAGNFDDAYQQLMILEEREGVRMDMKLLQLECIAYLRKPYGVIINEVNVFARAIKECYKTSPSISKFHLVRWALELKHNERHYGVIFVCCAISCLAEPPFTRQLMQFYLSYAMFVEMLFRVMNTIDKGSCLNAVLVKCTEAVLLDMATILKETQNIGLVPEWKIIGSCHNALATVCINVGMYDKAKKLIANAFHTIDEEIYPEAVIFSDLCATLGVVEVANGNLKSAVSCLEIAIQKYKSCEPKCEHLKRSEMVERVEKFKEIAKGILVTRDDQIAQKVESHQ